MTLAAQVEDVVPGEKTKRTPRPRKPAATNGNAATATARRPAAGARPRPPPRVAPKTEDAG